MSSSARELLIPATSWSTQPRECSNLCKTSALSSASLGHMVFAQLGLLPTAWPRRTTTTMLHGRWRKDYKVRMHTLLHDCLMSDRTSGLKALSWQPLLRPAGQ